MDIKLSRAVNPNLTGQKIKHKALFLEFEFVAVLLFGADAVVVDIQRLNNSELLFYARQWNCKCLNPFQCKTRDSVS